MSTTVASKATCWNMVHPWKQKQSNACRYTCLHINTYAISEDQCSLKSPWDVFHSKSQRLNAPLRVCVCVCVCVCACVSLEKTEKCVFRVVSFSTHKYGWGDQTVQCQLWLMWACLWLSFSSAGRSLSYFHMLHEISVPFVSPILSSFIQFKVEHRSKFILQ